jgi:SET domain-containing protein
MKESVTVKKSHSGFGLFTLRDFKKGDFIIEYTGEKITEEEANKRGGKYLFELNEEWTIDGKSRDNKARYINHSCKPNCYPEIDDTEEHIYIYAKKDIKEGEELAYDYGKMYFNELMKKGGCKCEPCRKITSEAK